jgi:hypothetical protein
MCPVLQSHERQSKTETAKGVYSRANMTSTFMNENAPPVRT